MKRTTMMALAALALIGAICAASAVYLPQPSSPGYGGGGHCRDIMPC